MKKILYVFCLIALISCKQTPKGIQGSWNRTERFSGEYFDYSLTFNNDGTYQSKTDNNSLLNSSFILLNESGQYCFIGEEEGILYLYRTNDTLQLKVRVHDNQLHIFYNCGVIEYYR